MCYRIDTDSIDMLLSRRVIGQNVFTNTVQNILQIADVNASDPEPRAIYIQGLSIFMGILYKSPVSIL